MRTMTFPPDLDEIKPRPDADDETRWRWLQKVGDLQELPKDAQGLHSGLEGDSFPRTSTFTSKAPRESVRAWLSECPGYWRYRRGLQHMQEVSLLQAGIPAGKPPEGAVASLASALEYEQGPAKPSQLPGWPATGRIGSFGCSAVRRTHCTATLVNAADSLVQVTLQYTTNPSRMQLAE